MSTPQIDAQPAAPTAAAAALERLARSRAQLRVALIPPPEAPGGDPGDHAPIRLLKYLWRRVRRAGRASPVVDLALDAVQAWWLTRPWLPAAAGVSRNLNNAVLPLVRRYPWAAVGVAAGAGAGLVLLRPWRWAIVRGSWPLWRAGLVAQAVHLAAQWPLESVLNMLMGALGAMQTPAKDRQAQPTQAEN